MEASLLNDASYSPSKQIKNTKRKTYHQIQHHHKYQQQLLQHQYQYQYQYYPADIIRLSSCDNNSLTTQHVQLNMVHASTGSVFLNHLPNTINNQTSLFSSLPPTLPSHHHNYHHQPPLLPLPLAAKPTFHSFPPLTRHSSLSSTIPRKQTIKKPHKTPSQFFNNRSSTTANKKNINIKKENTTNNTNSGSLLSKDDQAVGSTKGVGPHSRNYLNEGNMVKGMEDLKKENGDGINKFITPLSIFCLAPPPSSLPLPKFSLRQVQQNKISCKAEAAFEEGDTGAAAADNLCRLLKLR